MCNLEMASLLDKKLHNRFPTTFNHLFSTGYFTTPSARMSCEGEVGLGYAYVPPYTHWNGRLQLFRCLEISANYRIFNDVKDTTLSPHGFGDYADRCANIKWAIITPEASYYDLPGLAIGVEDFMGSKKFTNYFATLTKVWPSYGLETTIGWGIGRYTGPSKGVFGGFSYFPCWECDTSYLKGLGACVEYDPIDYRNPEKEPNPHGRVTHCPFNFGLKYKLGSVFDFSASYIRGDAFAFAGSVNYNLGNMKGMFVKIKDPPFYHSPKDTQPLGCYRAIDTMIHSLAYALECQGFCLRKAFLDQNTLRISVINECYRGQMCARQRLEHVLSCLIPSNITCIIVVIESYGLPCQQYVYSRELLTKHANQTVRECEMTILAPSSNYSSPSVCEEKIYYRKLNWGKIQVSPRLETFFGSAKGKFKYDFGVKANIEGFLPYDIFYELQLSYTLLSTTNDVSDFDIFSPSQLPNVLTDYVNYRKSNIFSTDRLYLQKHWNLGRGWFSKVAGGYFQVNYAGVEGEFLWYPANRNFAFGCEAALLKKRRYTGLGFQSTLRKLDGYHPTYIPYSFLNQYFFNFYCDFPGISVATKLSAGGFLARDKGLRLEVTRYFESGLRITGWITLTNANDHIHSENYYNRGIAIELPFDLFYRCSSRRVWNYGMAAWLRDAGATTTTGKPLFDIVNLERRP